MADSNDGRNRARKFRGLACYSSAIVLAALGAGQVQAQCVPNPSQAYQPITCSGTQTGGYAVSTDQSPLTVNSGASIQNSGDALTVSIPANSYYDYRTTTITVNGSIASSGGNGILIDSGMPYQIYYGYPGTTGMITVGAGGSISGTTGITLTPYPGNSSSVSLVSVSLDNSGSVTGTSGIALATSGGDASFSTITNESSGTIGAIAAAFSTLVNHGTIYGGTLSAITNTIAYGGASLSNDGIIQTDGAATTVQPGNSYSFTNSGTIANSGGGAAINFSGTVVNQAAGAIAGNGSAVLTGSNLALFNYGTVTNSGTGQAITGTYVSIQNYTGATISGRAGGAAIDANLSLNLTNFGTINGDVIMIGSGFVDSSLGTINGNVTFGSGGNTLVANIANGALRTGVTGMITGGTGAFTTNTLQITSTADATLSSSVALPTNFTQLVFAPASGTTLTLADGFSNPGTIVDQGPGTLTNATTLSGNGQIVSIGYSGYNFTNSGSINTSNSGGLAAISLTGYASLNNSGSITATGDAVSGSGYGISNTGTIAAGGTAVQAFLQAFSNSGIITSTGGNALVLTTSCTCTQITNSGTITGATIGAQFDGGVLNNSGTIASPGIGIAASFNTAINNVAGGVISGGTLAIGNPNGTSESVFVNNAGTINGDVNLVGIGFGSYASNTFAAAPGGILNGNLTLGSGDTLIAELANAGVTNFVGINGTVTANDSNLIYVVRADATVSAATPAGFDTVSFALTNSPTLTLGANTSYANTLQLAGGGTVDLDGTIATTNSAALFSSANLYQLNNVTLGTGLSLVNAGSITTTITMPYSGAYTAVVLGYFDTLTNAGTISLIDTTGGNSYLTEAAVTGGQSVTNSGTILGANAGAVAIGGYGYSSTPQLVNSGTLFSGSTTVAIEGAVTITNSGTIASTGQTAIGTANNYGYGGIIVNNLAGGVISGTGDAIELSGGPIANAGTINGNVNLAYPAYGYPSTASGAYYDNGGTLNGNLTLNPYEALVIAGATAGTGPLGGVTGTINANGAALVYNFTSSTTTSASGGTSGFGTVGYLIANNATLTLDANSNLASTLGVAGTGAVIFNGTITTSDAPALASQPPALLAAVGNTSATNALAITNNGTITTTADAGWYAPVAVSLSGADTFVNNGSITLADNSIAAGPAAAVSGGSVTNTGLIVGTNVSAIAPGASLVNSGTIASNVNAVTLVGITTITNSGTIFSNGAAAIGGEPYYSYNNIPANVVNLATGLIAGATDAIDMAGGVVINTGTINGNVNLATPYGYSEPGGYYDNGGTLNGNLTLTSGQVLLLNYGSTAGPLGGVTGTIAANGAALLYNIAGDTTITSIPSASGFGTVGYQLANSATLTVPGGTALTNTLVLTGTGSAVLNGLIATSDQPAVESTSPFAQINSNAQTALTITNNGTIVTATDSPYAVGQQAISLGYGDTLINNGSITLINTSGFAGYYDAAVAGGLAITNTGTITGSGVSAIDSDSYSSDPATLTNSGTLSSDQTTIQVSGKLFINNSGAIVSSGAAAISGETNYFYSGFSQAAISNLANGVISGVGDAVDLTGGSLANAGTINGNVNLAYSPYGGLTYAQGAYFNNGGTLNGNLTLGPEQSLYTGLGSVDSGNIGNAGSVQGITGTVTPNYAYLIYLVSANGSDAVTIPAGFGGIGYQLSNNATLTLSPPSPLTAQIDLSGIGSVIFNGSIATSGIPAIIASPAGTVAGAATTPNDLTITNNGTLSTALQGNYYFNSTLQPSTVFLTSGDTLINTGSIVLTNATGEPFATAAAVYGGAGLNNSGTISGVGVNAVSLGVPATTGGAALSLTNSGSITSDQLAVLTNGAATITNSGSITSSAGVAIAGIGAGTLITNQASGVITGSTDAIDLLGGTVANSGTINGNVNLAFGATATSGALNGGYFATGGTLNGNLVLGQGETLATDIANPGAGVTGTVTASGAALIYNVYATTTSTAALPTGFTSLAYQLVGNPTLTLASGSNLTTTLGLAGSGAVIFDGTIATTDAVAVKSQPVLTAAGYATTANALAITNNGTISATFDAAATAAPSAVVLGGDDSLTNSGTIASSGAPAVLKPGAGAGQLINLAGGVISSTTDAIDFAGGTVRNAGTITGNVDLGYAASGASANAAPAIYFANGGSVSGNLSFSSANGGNELIETGTGFGISGTISGGAGTNYVGHLIGFNGVVTLGNPLPTGFSVELTFVDGASHVVTLTGPANYATNIYVGGNGGIVNQANTSGMVTGLAASGEAYLAGMNAQLASFTNQAQVGGIALATNTLINSGTVGSATTAAPALTQTVNGTLLFDNSGTIVAQPGSGTTAQLAALITGTPTGASLIGNSGTITGGLAVAYTPAAGAALTITNSGTITGAPFGGAQDVALAVLPGTQPDTAGDTVAVTNSGTITGDIQLAAAGDTLIDAASGAITGNIFLRPNAGTGSITLAGNFTGNIDGGQGPSSLTVSGGSAAQPVAFGSITGVSGYSQTGGYATLAGTANIGNAAITGGTFVGLVGSTVNAALVTVGSGATFASGGTVNGNLTVGGTLQVGASPDTLTVKGNVALATGSTSVFEVSPTASSKLVTSGTVTIAPGTKLQIVQLQPIMAGTAIDLINAAGGVSGNFTSVAGINGALIDKNNQLEVVALFNATQAANPQAANGVNYLNTLLASGNASPALLAALPALQTSGGTPASQAFARFSPEAYATTTQIGTENALVVSRAARDIGWDTALHSGRFFTFGEALGNWRGLAGNGALGVSHAELSGYGFIGGIGVGSHTASLAAFGGYLDQSESIADLAASTHAKGFVGGVTGRLASGPAQLNVSVIYDDAHATTRRMSPDAIALSGAYTLHGWTVDGEASTSIALRNGWSAHPHVGATWVWTRRGGTAEDNSSAFALTVAGDHHDAGFVDGGVRFASPQDAVGRFSPFVDIGVRYQVEGRASAAIAGLAGEPVSLVGYGIRRRPVDATVASGITYRATTAVSLFATGSGDFARGDSSGSIKGGIKVVF